MHVPPTGAEFIMGRDNSSNAGKQQGYGLSRDFVLTVNWDVTDNNSCLGRGGQIDIVDTDPIADNRFAFSKCCDSFRGELDPTNENRIGITARLEDPFDRLAVAVIEFASSRFNNVAFDLDIAIAVLRKDNSKFWHWKLAAEESFLKSSAVALNQHAFGDIVALKPALVHLKDILHLISF
jgi:hypothetical protein